MLNIFAAEDAFCGTPVNAIRTSESTNTAVRGAEDEYVCCKDSNIARGYIKPDTDNADDFDKCSDFKSEGYRYEKLGKVACILKLAVRLRTSVLLRTEITGGRFFCFFVVHLSFFRILKLLCYFGTYGTYTYM